MVMSTKPTLKKARTLTDLAKMTREELLEMIRGVLEEVTSEKQKRTMCRWMNNPSERPESMSAEQAGEMCHSKVKKPKRKKKK